METNNRPAIRFTVLGGGLAGLSAGYYLGRSGRSFQILEKETRVGGNCVTFHEQDLAFDSGAHRFHDKDAEITLDLKSLLGDNLTKVDTPSRIYYRGRYFDFPLSPWNLLKGMGVVRFAGAGGQVLWSRASRGRSQDADFENHVINRYGRTISEMFLLNYSEKLWGMPLHLLSSIPAQRRLRGLDLRTFIVETCLGHRVKTAHLDGSFYYPRGGVGEIAEKLAEACGTDRIRTGSEVTALHHEGKRITGISLDHAGREPVDVLICTLPLPQLIQKLDPPCDDRILELSRSLRFRGLMLLALFLDEDSVTSDATCYFPDRDFIFTRVYEPKNRSPAMAPPHRTVLVAEIPANPDEEIWTTPVERITDRVCAQLEGAGLLDRKKVLGTAMFRMRHAYPIIALETPEILETLFDVLKDFDNLFLTGRNGRFTYASMHDVIRMSKDMVEGLLKRDGI